MASKDLVIGAKKHPFYEDSSDNLRSIGKEVSSGKFFKNNCIEDDLLDINHGGSDTFNNSSICEMPETSPKKSIKYTKSEDLKVSFTKPALPRDLDKELNIFILEDDTFNRDILLMYLTRYFKPQKSFITPRIDMKLSVNDALKSIDEESSKGLIYNIIFTDYHLTESKTGADFVRDVKEMYTRKSILHPAFFLVSGNSMINSPEASLFFKCILKPFTFDQFASELDRWFSVTGLSSFIHQSDSKASPQLSAE